ncbi:MAG: helix-turn-helix transcriptional regulator [bacterium]
MILDKKIIGKRVKKIRLEKGLTQAELAEMCNLSTSYISCIETGKKRPSLKSLEKLGKSLHVKVESFWVVNLKNAHRECESDLIQICRDFNSNQKQMLFEIALIIKKFS